MAHNNKYKYYFSVHNLIYSLTDITMFETYLELTKILCFSICIGYIYVKMMRSMAKCQLFNYLKFKNRLMIYGFFFLALYVFGVYNYLCAKNYLEGWNKDFKTIEEVTDGEEYFYKLAQYDKKYPILIQVIIYIYDLPILLFFTVIIFVKKQEDFFAVFSQH